MLTIIEETLVNLINMKYFINKNNFIKIYIQVMQWDLKQKNNIMLLIIYWENKGLVFNFYKLNN